MVWTLVCKDHFDAAHHLPFHQGKCKRPHGHTYHVLVEVTINKLDSNGLAIDFDIIKDPLKRIVKFLDHYDLNEVFKDITWFTTTAEHIAMVIDVYVRSKVLEYLKGFSTGCGTKTTVQETPTNAATYWYDFVKCTNSEMNKLTDIKSFLEKQGLFKDNVLFDKSLEAMAGVK